ncbi:WecB/TagA/CpsF family glycosyltransferase [Niallia oryzisoli]|uniref:WecB/TagA/CpsF family glycosyltransferase n=1 Tax=Niallia oryzisoli TaxID=1737571 RepID=UPI0037351404
MSDQYVDILGVSFYNTNRFQFVQQLDKHIINNDKVFVVTANPEIVMHANEEPKYMEIIKKATYIIPDGIGIIKASRYLHRPIEERVPGFDTMIDLLNLANAKSYSIYLLGAKPGTVDKAVLEIEREYPQIDIKGFHHGYFDWNSTEIRQEIMEKKPDLVFVALGVPRQEKWIENNLPYFEKGIFMGIGGSFDVIAGEAKRAPLTWRKMNLEWLYRFIKQPSRGSRMLAIPKFVIEIFKQKVNERK